GGRGGGVGEGAAAVDAESVQPDRAAVVRSRAREPCAPADPRRRRPHRAHARRRRTRAGATVRDLERARRARPARRERHLLRALRGRRYGRDTEARAAALNRIAESLAAATANGPAC